MKLKIASLFICLSMILVSFTGCQAMARNWGGTSYIDLPPNTKLMEATWKESSIWYLYREAREGEEAETYVFQESSNLGILEGRVIFKETIE